MRWALRMLATAAAIMLGSACQPTVWPSGADRGEFCTTVVGEPLGESQYDDLERLGTPENMPYEGRRYLLHRADGDDTDPTDQRVFEKYVADYC